MKNNKGEGNNFIIFFIAIIVVAFLLAQCEDDHHAPGYGDTSTCTICGKAATHHSSHYGYCNKHWKDATGQ